MPTIATCLHAIGRLPVVIGGKGDVKLMIEKFKKVLTSDAAIAAVKSGIEIATNLISPTLGSNSKKIILDREFGALEVLDDGHMILREIELEDPSQQMGVKLLQEAVSKTNEIVGDGTTTTTILTREMIVALCPDTNALVVSKSPDPLSFKKDFANGVEKVIAKIDEMKIPTDDDRIKQVAVVSSGSEILGDMVAKLFSKIGTDASIVVSDSQSLETTYEIVEGMRIDRGFISPAFVTDGEKGESIIENPKVLVTDMKLQDPENWLEIKKLLESSGIRDMVIIADDVSGLPLKGLIANRIQFGMRLLAIKAPGFGQMKEYLKDIAALTGATIITQDNDMQFKDLKLEQLGTAEKIISKQDSTSIVNGGGGKENINSRIEQLKKILSDTDSKYEKEKIEERISKLTGGVGIIKVGGSTAPEVEDKKAKLDDAIHAVKASLKDGIVAGGGIALLRASQFLDKDNYAENLLKNIIQKPFLTILKNADIKTDGVVDKILLQENINYGYNTESEEYCDLVDAGIIDPALVVKTALRNALSIAIQVASTGGANVIVRKSDREQNTNDTPRI